MHPRFPWKLFVFCSDLHFKIPLPSSGPLYHSTYLFFSWTFCSRLPFYLHVERFTETQRSHKPAGDWCLLLHFLIDWKYHSVYSFFVWVLNLNSRQRYVYVRVGEERALSLSYPILFMTYVVDIFANISTRLFFFFFSCTDYVGAVRRVVMIVMSSCVVCILYREGAVLRLLCMAFYLPTYLI